MGCSVVVSDIATNMAEIVVYFTSVSSSTKTKKDQQSVEWLLEAKNVDFEKVDVSRDLKAGEAMRKKSGKRTLPQVFINGEYVGVRISLVSHARAGR
jgi:glutaredoxin